MKRKNIVIIPAAGSGSRMKNSVQKQFLKIDDQPVIVKTIKKFQRIDEISDIYLIIGKEHMEYFDQEIIPHYLRECSKIRKIIPGGKTRFDSVFAGLKIAKGDHLDNPDVNVIIHDGVRPFFTEECVRKGISLLEKEVGVVTGVKIKDTVKIISDSYAEANMDRDRLIGVQTPQFFRLDILYTCYKESIKLDSKPTDDSSVMISAGYKVRVIEGDYYNIKLTTPEDLVFAEVILSMQQDIYNVD